MVAVTSAATIMLTPSAANAVPVEYVKVCSLYGAGFFYLPGTDTCINFATNDARTQTEGGVWRCRVPNNPRTCVASPEEACQDGADRLCRRDQLHPRNERLLEVPIRAALPAPSEARSVHLVRAVQRRVHPFSFTSACSTTTHPTPSFYVPLRCVYTSSARCLHFHVFSSYALPPPPLTLPTLSFSFPEHLPHSKRAVSLAVLEEVPSPDPPAGRPCTDVRTLLPRCSINVTPPHAPLSPHDSPGFVARPRCRTSNRTQLFWRYAEHHEWAPRRGMSPTAARASADTLQPGFGGAAAHWW